MCKSYPRFVKLDPTIPDIPLTEEDIDRLNLPAKSKPISRSSISLSTTTISKLLSQTGREVQSSLAHGNCFFRSLSSNLYGHQNEHFAIRKVIVKFIEVNRDKETQLLAHNYIKHGKWTSTPCQQLKICLRLWKVGSCSRSWTSSRHTSRCCWTPSHVSKHLQRPIPV